MEDIAEQKAKIKEEKPFCLSSQFRLEHMEDCGYTGQRMLTMELPGRRKIRSPQRRFMDELKEDMQWVGLIEKDVRDKIIQCGNPLRKQAKQEEAA